MKEVLQSDQDDFNRIITYAVENSGKMLRPRMVLMAAGFYPHDAAMVLDIAVAVELIHLASLVHDDIIDESMLRRGRRSVNGLWGNQAGVLTGDYLFAAAFKLINSYGLQDIMESITETIQIMCSGEIKQMSIAYNTDTTEDDYLDKTYRKTAALFACSCKVGALASSMPAAEIKNLEQFGLYLGYAYQIMDDVLDFVSDSSHLGKPAGNDLLQGNVTLPVIHALNDSQCGSWLRHMIQAHKLTAHKLPKVTRILNDTGSLDYAYNRSREFLHMGLEKLHLLPELPQRQELENLARYLMNGYYDKLNTNKITTNREAVE